MVKHHQHHFSPGTSDKSAMAECRINLGHFMQLQNTTILSTKSTYMDQVIRKAIVIELCPNMNREDGLHLSQFMEALCPLSERL
jgi:hypothetical protein